MKFDTHTGQLKDENASMKAQLDSVTSVSDTYVHGQAYLIYHVMGLRKKTFANFAVLYISERVFSANYYFGSVVAQASIHKKLST